MLVLAEIGDRSEAEVTALYPGKSIEVSLESGETATLSWSGVKGFTDSDKLDRALSLRLGSKLEVDVINVYVGQGFKRKIDVREVGWKPSRLPHPKGRHRPRRNRAKDGGVRSKHGTILTWRAS